MTKSFFVRADPLPGESIYGYLYRLGEVQGQSTYKWIYNVFPGQLDRAKNGTLLTSPDLKFLADALRLPSHSLDEMRFPMRVVTSGNWRNSKKISRFICRSWSLERQDFTNDPLKFCPLCIQEDTSHLLIWHLKFVVTCPHHRCRMVNSCPSCHHQYRQHEVKNGRCGNCSNVITPSFVPDDYLHRTVTSLLSMIGGYTGIMERHGLPLLLRDTELSTALKLIFFFAKLSKTNPRHGRNAVYAHMEEDLRVGMAVCERFHNSSEWILQRLADRNKNITSRFNSLKVLVQNGSRGTSDLVYGAIQDFNERERSNALHVPRATDRESEDTEFVRIDKAAERLHLTKVVVKKIAARQHGPSWRKKWMKSTYIHPAEVRWIQECLDECISSKEAGKALGVSDRHQIQSLYDHFLFPHPASELQIDHRHHSFHRDSVEDFCRMISELPERTLMPELEMSWRTAKAVYMSRHHASIDFYRAVIQRELIPVGRQPGIKGLPGLIFRRDCILAISNGDQVGACAISTPSWPSVAKSNLH